MKYYLKHRNFFQGIVAWTIIFGACAGTKYWWIPFFMMSIMLGLIERYVDKKQMAATKNDKAIADQKGNVGDRLVKHFYPQ